MPNTARKERGERGGKDVQSPDDTGAAKPHFMTGDSDNESGEPVVRLGIDLPQSEVEFIERLVAYRNLMAKVRGMKMRRQWTRKTQTESLVSARIAEVKSQLKQMIDACGDIPDDKDEVAMRRYVEKVIAWDKKMEKAGK